MALTLNGGINADARDIVITGTVGEEVQPEYLFAIDDEILQLQAFHRDWPQPADRNAWRVRRAMGGSIAASHDNGASIFGIRDDFARAADEMPPGQFNTTGLTGNEIAAIQGASSPSGKNPYATRSDLANLPSADQKAALDAADPPLDADHPPLTRQTIDLSDTDGTTAQVSEVLDTRGGKSLALESEITSPNGGDGLDVEVLTRNDGRPWCVTPAIETRGETGPAVSEGTVWPALGTDIEGHVLPTTFLDLFAATLAKSIVITQPMNGSGTPASVTLEALSDQSYVIEVGPGGAGTSPSSGHIKVVFRTQTTTAVDWNKTSADLVAALAALPAIGAGNVTTDNPDWDLVSTGKWQFRFTGTLGSQAVEAPTLTDVTLDPHDMGEPDVAEDIHGGDPSGAAVTFSCALGGDWGNALSVTLIDPGLPDQPMSITSTTGWDLLIGLSTDGDGLIVSTDDDVALVVNGGVAPAAMFAPFAIRAVSAVSGTPMKAGSVQLADGSGGATAVTYRTRG